MPLYVVGEDTPDASKWSIWSDYALVVADTAEQARDLVGWSTGQKVCEIPLDRPQLLVQMTEPNWGDDI